MSQAKIGGRLSSLLNNLDALPAMPEIAHKLLALDLDTEAGESQMLRLITRDPQLSARIIGLANASATGLSRKTNSIYDAAMLLGLNKLKSVAVAMSILSKMAKPATKYFDPHDLWTHSVTCAIIMNRLTQTMPDKIRPNENQTFLAGLLHDIGLFALHHFDPAASDNLHHQVLLQPRRPICEIEHELFGVTHCTIAEQLVRHWNLPAEIIEAVSLHHTPRNNYFSFGNSLARMICISERLLPDFGLAEHTERQISDAEWSNLGISPAHAEELLILVNEMALQIAQLPDLSYDPPPSETAPSPEPAPEPEQEANIARPHFSLWRWLKSLPEKIRR